MVFSTSTDAQIGALSFLDGDLVLWDTSDNTFSIYLSESVFGGTDEDIDAVHVFDDGTIAMSTTSSANLSGTSFRPQDVVRYDPITEVVSLLFNGDLFDTAGEDIDAFEAPGDPSFINGMLLSTSTDATVGGISVLDGDLFLYDGSTIFDTDIEDQWFQGADEDIDAFALLIKPDAVPAPSSITLLIGALVLLRRKL